jgi:GntR family transcriptional regulator
VPVPDLADPRAPYLQIADDLRRQINAGRYQPGDRLPSNKAMAGEYNTSTETVRRALRVLTDAGLVGAHSTLGTFVLNPPADPEPDPVVRLEAEVRELADDHAGLAAEVAKLREELEFTQAQVMALGGGVPAQGRDVGT